jgi:hypothetical protein
MSWCGCGLPLSSAFCFLLFVSESESATFQAGCYVKLAHVTYNMSHIVLPAGEMMQQGWALLDIRPPTETQKVGIVGAVAVPLYVEDPSNSFGSLLKKSATIGTGGWWLGGTHMIPNNDFLAQVG